MALTARDLVKQVKNIVSLPTVYTRLREVILLPSSSAGDIGKIVSEDPGLTARLLKLVNSAFFGFPSKIDTVSRAITLVGTQQLSDLALATSVMSSFDGVSDEFISMDLFWQHSLAAGVFSRVIATLRGEENIERFFVAGMLHDLGKLILFVSQPKLATKCFEVKKEKKILMIDAENEVLGFNHTDIGFELLSMWNLPANLIEPVGFHHTPLKSVKYPIETCTVHVSDIFANAFKMGTSGETFIPKIENGAWEKLKLQIDHVNEIVEETKVQYNDVIKVFLK